MGDETVTAGADAHGFSQDAVEAARDALRRGRGMAQFSHPELGGMGQWSPGMLMIGAMSDHALKARVDALFHALAREVEREPRAAGGGMRAEAWWPADLGEPASTGAQDDLRYAHFPDRDRLATWERGRVRVFDTGGRTIGGFGQQGGGTASFSLSGPDGAVPLDRLREVGGGAEGPTPGGGVERPRRDEEAAASHEAGDDPIGAIGRLADLHRAGVLTDAEFADKKKQLLARIG